jgi:hypothetical protein
MIWCCVASPQSTNTTAPEERTSATLETFLRPALFNCFDLISFHLYLYQKLLEII